MFNIFNGLLCYLRDTVGEHGKARHAMEDVPVRCNLLCMLDN